MTLLEDARRLTSDDVIWAEYDAACRECGRPAYEPLNDDDPPPPIHHKDACAYGFIERVLPLLEAADRLQRADAAIAERRHRDLPFGRVTVYLDRPDPLFTEKHDAYQALVTAMRGEEVMA